MLSPRAKILASVSASASRFWPRPGLDLVVLLIGHFSCKNRIKFRNFVNFSGNNLKSYVVNHYLVLFNNYFWPRPRPRPRSFGPGLGIGLVALASASASRFWPHLTSLQIKLDRVLFLILCHHNHIRLLTTKDQK